MYSKNELLNNFYTTIDRTQVKIETKCHGFDYLQELGKMGTLEYSEWKNGVFKYKLIRIQPDVFDRLLQEHLDSQINLCAFFNEEKNNIFCFNLDCFSKSDKGIRAVAQFLEADLKKLRIQPLVLRSGHGYHFWCRLSCPVENSKLQSFMKSMVDVATFQAVMKNINISELQCICYPRFKSHDISIRLFGSKHSVIGMFNSVVTKIGDEDEMLDEESSWQYFENYIESCTIQEELFEQALKHAIHLASIVS